MNFVHIKQWISVGILFVLVLLSNVLAHEGCASHENCASTVSAPVVASNGAAADTEKNVAVSTDVAKDAGQAKQAGQPDQLLFQVLDGNKDVIKAFMDSLVNGNLQKRMRQMEEKRLRLLDILPEALRATVQNAIKMHMHVAEQLKLDIFLRSVCNDLFERIQRQIPDDAPCKKDAIVAVELLNRALSDGSFMRVITVYQLSGDMQDPQRMMRQLLDMMQQPHEQSTFTEQDIVTIRTRLEAVRQYALAHSSEATGLCGFLATDLATFIQYLGWAEKKDIHALSAACINKMSPLLDDCLSNLKTTVRALADERLHTSQDVKPELVEALEFWMKQLNAQIHTLAAFQRVVTLSGIDLSYLLQGLSNAYEVAEGVFAYMRRDETISTTTTSPGILDYLFNTVSSTLKASNVIDICMRTAILGLTAVHRVGEVASGEIQKCILGTGSLSEFVNPFDDPSYALMLLMHSTPILMHPSRERLSIVQRGFLRVSAALLWNYYGQYYRGSAWNKWPVNGLATNSSGDTKVASDGKAATVTQAPADTKVADTDKKTESKTGATAEKKPEDPNELLRTALLVTVKELQYFVTEELVNTVKCNDHPRDGKPCRRCIALENLEKYSLGIVKPDLVPLVFEMLTTVALFKVGAVKDVMGTTEAGQYALYYAKRGYLFDDFLFRTACGTEPGLATSTNDQAKINFYIQYQLVRYLFESVGTFCGKNIVHNSLYGAVSGITKDIGSLLGRAGKFVFDISDEDEQAIVSQYQRYITEMRTVLRTLFCEQSPERVVMVGLLKNMRLLSEDDNDPKKVNFSIIAIVLYYLAQYHFITHVQEAQLYEEYPKHQNDVMKFLDIVFDMIAKNKESIVGGKVGGMAGSALAAWNGVPLMRSAVGYFWK